MNELQFVFFFIFAIFGWNNPDNDKIDNDSKVCKLTILIYL